MSEVWHRRKGESAKAYAAFCTYRELGSERSIDKSFALQSDCETTAGRAYRHWFQWSKEFEWKSRSDAWDAHCEQLREKEFHKRLKELAHEQAEFAVEEFQRLVRRVRKADAVLSRADDAPVSETEEETVDGSGRVTGRKRVKPLNFAGYAALMKEIRESAQRAILGPRDGVGDGKKGVAAEGDGTPSKIVWIPDSEDPQPAK